MIETIKHPQDEDVSLSVHGLSFVADDHPSAIETLTEIIKNHYDHDQEKATSAAASLAKIQNNNILAIRTLIEVIKNPESTPDEYHQALEVLEDIFDDNNVVAEALVEAVNTPEINENALI